MSDALRRKRERQARRLLRVCLREFNASCLQGYVDAYESSELSRENECNAATCALGSMGGYDRLTRNHSRAAAHVENIYEGYGVFFRTPFEMARTKFRFCDPAYGSWSAIDSDIRRRWIYEACVEELARRNSESVLSPEARFVEVTP